MGLHKGGLFQYAQIQVGTVSTTSLKERERAHGWEQGLYREARHAGDIMAWGGLHPGP